MKRAQWNMAMILAVVLTVLAGTTTVALAQGTSGAGAVAAAPAAGQETAAPEKSGGAFLLFDPDFCKRMDEFIKRTKQPAPWFSWGADFRARTIWSDNMTTLDDETPNHERHFQRYRSRVWGTLKPTEDIDVNVRFVWEPRVIQKGPRPNGPVNSRYIWDEVVFDRFNVTLRNVADLPLTLVLGRQDILLGNGWLVIDGTPLEGTRTLFFDAVRATWDARDIDTKFDVIYIDNDDDNDRWVRPFNQTGQTVMEQDERGLIFYVTNTSLEKATIEGFYIYKHDTPRAARGNDSELHTVGGRTVTQLTDNLTWRGEGAYQWGEQNNMSLRAFAVNNRVTYACKDPLDNRFHVDYEFLSGDDPDSAGSIQSFDPLWGRYPQWSELYFYTVAMERGRPGEVTNLHRLAFGWQCKPADPLTFRTRYHLLWSDENTNRANARFTRGGSFRGQLLEGKLSYKFCERVSGHLVGEAFFPGNFYSSAANEPALFFRYELMFTW